MRNRVFDVLMGNRSSRRNLVFLIRFVILLVVLIGVYSYLFHVFMAMEGREYSWVTGVYWTLTVMSTLGFGDITFHTDAGLIFSLVVLLSGTTFMLALFPFLFIQFFYTPLLQAQQAAKSPRQLPRGVTNHVVLTHYDDVTMELIERLDRYQYPYVLLTPTVEETLRLRDLGVNAIHGELDDEQTFQRIHARKAAMVVTTGKDEMNAHVAFTVRDYIGDTQVVATADDEASVDILQLAGCSHVIQLANLMGQALARRTLAGDAMTHIVGRFDELLIAEATVHNTPLIGKTLRESGLRDMVSVSVVGLWERGAFRRPDPDAVITEHAVLVLAGSRDQLRSYDDLFCIYNTASKPVIIIGGGRVGRATAAALKKRAIPYRIVETDAARILDPDTYIHGSAADLAVLERAGIRDASAVIVTTHEDDTNVYLTIYCRRLRPDIQIISRATLQRNVKTLHRAGADIVMSYAAMGANTIFNLLKRSDVVLLAEGLDFFRTPVPAALAGKTLLESDLRNRTGCTVVAIKDGGTTRITPDPGERLPEGGELVLVGDELSEETFLRTYA